MYLLLYVHGFWQEYTLDLSLVVRSFFFIVIYINNAIVKHDDLNRLKLIFSKIMTSGSSSFHFQNCNYTKRTGCNDIFFSHLVLHIFDLFMSKGFLVSINHSHFPYFILCQSNIEYFSELLFVFILYTSEGLYQPLLLQ